MFIRNDQQVTADVRIEIEHDKAMRSTVEHEVSLVVLQEIVWISQKTQPAGSDSSVPEAMYSERQGLQSLSNV